MPDNHNPFEELDKENYYIDVIGLSRGSGDPDGSGYPGEDEEDESKAD